MRDTGVSIERKITGMIELLEHNKETYRKLCEVLSENNKCALVQATGTGKSYIAGKYIEEHDVKALILVPTNAISDAWDELLAGMEEKFDISTYQAFAKEPGNYFDYDLVIADEMHHLGSGVWGRKFVDTYLQNENHKIIGLTATEIRYLDNSRDMAEEIFENIRVDGCDLPTAINTGVLPTFKYVSALYCDERDFDEWKEKAGKIKDVKVQEELKGKLDVCIKNMISVKQAINENLTDDYTKIIVFLNNVESKETALEMFKDVFPTANFYDVDYSKRRSSNNEQISQFKADENRAVLFAVDMLNEGVHIKGTDSVIMFRKTVSPQIYLQQLGRGLASGTDKMPVIFDFVSNTENIRRKFGSKNGQGIIRTWNESIKKDNKIIVKIYCLEIEDLILEISDLTGGRKWTEEEEKYIYENYETKSIREISEELKRNFSVVYRKMIDMGIYNKKYNRWTQEEDLFLNQNKDNMTIEEIAKKLGREKNSVANRKKKYSENKRKSPRKWTSSDDEYILCNYGNKSIRELAIELNASESGVKKRIKEIGITKRIFPYTKEEDDYIKNNCGKETIGNIAIELGRTIQSVQSRASRLKIQFLKKSSVVQLSIFGEYIATYESIADAAKAIQKGSSNISCCLRHKTKTAYGYKWMYEEDYQKMLEEQKAGD